LLQCKLHLVNGTRKKEALQNEFLVHSFCGGFHVRFPLSYIFYFLRKEFFTQGSLMSLILF
jgi:hypothetical protein